MASIYFYYSSMNAGKSGALVQANFNYLERGMRTLVLKPMSDTRDSSTPAVVSRMGLRVDAVGIPDNLYDAVHLVDDILAENTLGQYDVILIDEVQFLKPEILSTIAVRAKFNNVPLLCYGLRNSFDGEGFPASDWLLRHADKIREMKSLCWCGAKATHNAMVLNGVMVNSPPGGSNMILGNDIYTSLCFLHFLRKEPHKR